MKDYITDEDTFENRIGLGAVRVTEVFGDNIGNIFLAVRSEGGGFAWCLPSDASDGKGRLSEQSFFSPSRSRSISQVWQLPSLLSDESKLYTFLPCLSLAGRVVASVS